VAVAARRVPVALPFRQVRQVGRRLTWGIADQAMCNLTNFLLSIYIARTLGAAQFGAFSLAYVTYGFAINASRGLSIEPLLIRFSGTKPEIWRRAAAGCSGTALLVGIVSGVLALGVGALVGGTTGLAFLGLGITLPGLLLQDSWRYSFFAQARGRDAFINDTAWAVIQIPLMVLLKISGHANVFWFVVAWGTGAAVGAVLGSVQARVIPNLVRAREWLIAHRDLGPRYLAENTGQNAASSLQSYGVTYILGLAAVGYIQAANVLMGPFRVIFFGMGMITIPEATGLLRRSPRKMPIFCLALSVGLTLLAVVWGAVLLIAMPRGLGHLLLGGIWRPTYPLVLPATLAIMASCASTGAGVGLHALGAARRSLRATLLTSLIIVACALVGALTGGTLGTMRYAAAGTFLGALVSWWQLRQALHETPRVGVPTWLLPRQAGRHHRPPAADSLRYRRHVRRTIAAGALTGAPPDSANSLTDRAATGRPRG
jgi:O-antigen/teichoic acid export membrane protein